MSEEQKEKNKGAIALLEQWKNRDMSEADCTGEGCKVCEEIEKLSKQEDAHLELAIKYYTQGFEDAREEVKYNIYSSLFNPNVVSYEGEHVTNKYKSLDDALKARGLK